MNLNYLSIEGNVGAGKTTLAKLLAKQYNAEIILEEFEENPFLTKFFENQEEYALRVELSFLTDRYHQLSKINKNEKTYVADYYFRKSELFAKNNLKADEAKLFSRIHDIMLNELACPDLMIYLDWPTDLLLRNIQKRGREFEQKIKSDYLDSLTKAYREQLEKEDKFPILWIDCEKYNFIENPNDYRFLNELLAKKHPMGITNIN